MQTKRILISLMVAVLAVLTCKGQVCADSLRYSPRQAYDYFFTEAMVQRQQGNSDAAFDLLRHCVELNPSASEAYYFLADYYALLKNKEKAQQYLEKAVALSPGTPTYMERLANTYIANKQYAEAIPLVEQLYDLDKNREDLLELLFQLQNEEEEYDSAIKTLERLETIDGKSERLSYAKSEVYTAMGNQQAAIAEMKALADRYPNDLNYRSLYAGTLVVNGESEKARDIFNDILRQEPDNIHAQLSMRGQYKALEDTLAADSMTRRILTNKSATTEQKTRVLRQEVQESEEQQRDSTHILGLFDVALSAPEADTDIAMLYAAYMDLKKMPHDSIAPVLHWVLDRTPNNASARLQLVSFAWDADSLDRVISLCQAARQYNPEEMAFYYYQGMAYYRQDDYDRALDAFQNGIGVISEDSSPAIVSDFYAVMGDLLHQKGREREAFAAYDSCLVWKEDNIGCLNNYAYYLSELGRELDRAEQMSYKTIKAEPQNATYLDTYAWILFMQRRYSEARIYIDQALQNDPDSSSVMAEHAGDIYMMAGQAERAVELWRQALEKTPDNKVLIRKIKLKKYLKK